MKKDEEGEMTNLVQTNLEMIAHSSHSHHSKNASKRRKIQNQEENGKKQMVKWNFNLFWYLIGSFWYFLLIIKSFFGFLIIFSKSY